MSSPSSSPAPAPVSQDAALAVAKALGNLSQDDNIGSQLTGLNPQAYRAARLAESDGGDDDDDDDDDKHAAASATKPSHGAVTAVTQPANALPLIAATPATPAATSTATPSHGVPNLNDARMRYSNAWHVSARSLIRAVVDDELAVGTLTGLDKRVVGGLLYTLIIAHDQNVLEGLLLGDLPARLRYLPPMQHALQKMMDEAQEAADEARKLPGIYGNWLVDVQGQSPTPTELRRMIAKAWDYVDESGNSDAANRVDKQKAPILEARLDLLPTSDVDKPLRAPLCEFGFSIYLIKRLKDHKNHVNSNYIMNLFEAIATTVHGSKYAIEQHIVYIIPWGHLCELAEIFATRIGFGMTGLGGGFSHQLPGRNNSSAYKVSDEDWEEAEKAAGRVVDIERQKTFCARQLQNEQRSVEEKLKEAEKYEALVKERDDKRAQLLKALQPLPEEMQLHDRLKEMLKNRPDWESGLSEEGRKDVAEIRKEYEKREEEEKRRREEASRRE
ncbi:hypothetical protein KC347_g8736 [Hortaea werneckii]|nr:hypothetical protein KC347_g8736 [Hortaea werneckii]